MFGFEHEDISSIGIGVREHQADALLPIPISLREAKGYNNTDLKRTVHHAR